jgi:hypothetical protein
MPRNYKKKRPGPSYIQEDMERAVSDVENKNKTFRQAEEFYGIPKAVIYHRIKPNICKKYGGQRNIEQPTVTSQPEQ